MIRLVAKSGASIVGLAEMFIGTMHAYCLNLLQQHVPETFRFNVLTDITSRMLDDRSSKQSGRTTCPATVQGGARSLKRFVDSQLYLSGLGTCARTRSTRASSPKV